MQKKKIRTDTAQWGRHVLKHREHPRLLVGFVAIDTNRFGTLHIRRARAHYETNGLCECEEVPWGPPPRPFPRHSHSHITLTLLPQLSIPSAAPSPRPSPPIAPLPYNDPCSPACLDRIHHDPLPHRIPSLSPDPASHPRLLGITPPLPRITFLPSPYPLPSPPHHRLSWPHPHARHPAALPASLTCTPRTIQIPRRDHPLHNTTSRFASSSIEPTSYYRSVCGHPILSILGLLMT